jgi:hypothetical protein
MGDILTQVDFERVIASAVERLVSVRHDGSGAFVTTPTMYPSGGSVVVWISRELPYFLVSDYGFGFRECAIMGADRRQFMTRATPVAEAAGVRITNDGAFEATVSEGQLEGALKTIAACSQEVALRFAHRIFQRQRADAGTVVFRKLERLYGERAVSKEVDFLGASQSHWNIDVMVKRDGETALFDTVTPWAQSVAFTLAKFGDIRLLDDPPARTAVLASKSGYGNWLTALAQNANIIQANAEDDAFRRAASIQLLSR